VFYKDAQNIYRARPLEAFDWLVHGFGTRWSEGFGSCGNLATLRQVHSNAVVHAKEEAGRLGEGDALVTDSPALLLGIRTADCLPILLVDARLRATAAVHAGWRGTVAGVTAAALAQMQEKFSTRPEDVHAAIGPGIGSCCFEVGSEVAAHFGIEGKSKIDLIEANRLQLLRAGVAPGRIYAAGLCTFCGKDFFSFRRERDSAGRMLSVIGTR
jgi:polyphenol oxidase